MSEFYKILKTRNLDFHNGQPLWKYSISDFELEQIKEKFKIVERISELDPRTCAVYYAEWWKRIFNGGYPSKDAIYNSIGSSNLCFNANDLYELAKKGGNLLNFKWIKLQNTHYLKTLLLQGGLPLKHIKNNQGKYRDFLLKIIHINPNSIEDFSSNSELTSLLPNSSQNDIIYSSCLEIVRAVLDNDEAELISFKNNKDLEQITNELILERDKVRKSSSNIKLKWNFNVNNNTFYLNAKMPTNVGIDDLKYLLKNTNEIYQNEYKLFIDNQLVSKFVKRNSDSYKVIQIQNHIEFKNELGPDIYIIDSQDNYFDVSHILNSSINLSSPTLWSNSSENNFVLEKSRHTKNSFGYVLFDKSLEVTGTTELIKEFIFNDVSYLFIMFQDSINLTNKEGNNFKFRTNTENIFDWNIFTEKPKWLIRSNIQVVKNYIKVIVYDKEGNRINNAIVEWKSVNDVNWKSLHNPLSLGSLDIKISYKDVEEYDRVFNIGNLELKADYDIQKPRINFKNNCFKIEIYPSEYYEYSIKEDKIDFNISNQVKFPTNIKTRLTFNNQSAGLIAEVVSPFQGVIIVNQDENVINDEVIYIDSIKGWRLITNYNDKDFVARISNNKNLDVKISRQIDKKIKSLQEFSDIFKSLFQLYSIIDEENYLKMEINEILPNGKSRKIKSLLIKQFSEKINWSVNIENEIQFDRLEKIDITDSVFAIPLDCEINKINKLELVSVNDHFKIKTDNGDKFILFSDKNSKHKIKPEFISINPDNEFTNDLDRNSRILNFSEQLLHNNFDSEVWKRFLIYYHLCKANDLPFATFDIIKAITTSSKLAVKAFAFLSQSFDFNNFQFSGNDFIELENDLGFSFHWIKLTHWEEIMEEYPNLYEATPRMIGLKWNKLKLYLLQKSSQNDFLINAELTNVRQRLSTRVINELPEYNIREDRNEYMNVLPKKQWEDNINILIVAPLIVASSIKQNNCGLWHVNADNFRRKIKYVEEIDVKWYEDSLIYYLNRL
jgi:hypothetical protein